MSGVQGLVLYARIVEISALVTGVLFVLQYTWYSPWWRDVVGRTMVAEAVAVFLSVAPGTIENFLNLTYAERVDLEWVNVSFVALIPVIYVWRMFVWQRLPHGTHLLGRWKANRKKKRGEQR